MNGKGGNFSLFLGMKHLLMDIVYYYRAIHFFSYHSHARSRKCVLWKDFLFPFILLKQFLRALNFFCHGSNNNNSKILSSFAHKVKKYHRQSVSVRFFNEKKFKKIWVLGIFIKEMVMFLGCFAKLALFKAIYFFYVSRVL